MRRTSSVFPIKRRLHGEIDSLGLLGTTMHPLMDVMTKETPMLSYLRCRQFTDPGEFIYGGFWHPKEAGHVHDR